MTTASSTYADNPFGIKASPVCPYCGKELETTSITVFGATYDGLPCFGTCGCKRAKEYLDGDVMTDAERRQKRYASAGIGRAYFDAEVEDESLLESVLAGKGLFVTGPIRAGKTHLASAVAMKCIDSGLSVRFETVVGILRELRDSFNGVPTEALERAFDCDVLVLDDLGKESPTSFALSVLFELVDERVRNGLPIVVTTNYEGGELVKRVGAENFQTAAAIVARLKETCIPVSLPERRLS